MASRFSSPFPQFLNSTPEVLSGAQLFFYEAGTSTKLDTYSDASLSTPNTNPVVLNSSGYPDVDIFLANQAYKIVFAPATDTDPPTSPIWTADNYYGTDLSTVAQTKVGSGAPTGSVSGTAGSAGVLPTLYWDYTNEILYVATATGTAATTEWTALNASASTPSVPPPQGYLTLVSGTPVIVSDQVAATTVYYMPEKGNLIPIYNGANFTPTTFSELSLDLVSSHVASTIYDIFVWSESGVITLGTGPAWTTSTAGAGDRGTGASTAELTRVQGLLVNAVSMTTRNGSTTYTVGANSGTYVGSIFMDATNGQVTCHRAFGQSRKWGLWNAYNRRPIYLQMGDGTASWGYTSATVRQSNAAAGNTIAIFSGLAEELFYVNASQTVSLENNDDGALMGIGVNSTTAYSGRRGRATAGASAGVTQVNEMVAQHVILPAIGIQDVNFLESTTATGTQTFQGGNDDMLMVAGWMG